MSEPHPYCTQHDQPLEWCAHHILLTDDPAGVPLMEAFSGRRGGRTTAMRHAIEERLAAGEHVHYLCRGADGKPQSWCATPQAAPIGALWENITPVFTTMREQVKRDILDAFGVSLEEVEALDAALGGPQLRERERRFLAALPRRMAKAERDVNGRYAGVLPEGMRFEWVPKDDAVP